MHNCTIVVPSSCQCNLDITLSSIDISRHRLFLFTQFIRTIYSQVLFANFCSKGKDGPVFSSIMIINNVIMTTTQEWRIFHHSNNFVKPVYLNSFTFVWKQTERFLILLWRKSACSIVTSHGIPILFLSSFQSVNAGKESWNNNFKLPNKKDYAIRARISIKFGNNVTN